MENKEVGELIENLTAFDIVGLLAPVASKASILRGCGVRLVVSPETLAALQKMAEEGNQDAELLAANMFPRGHQEVLADNASETLKVSAVKLPRLY